MCPPCNQNCAQGRQCPKQEAERLEYAAAIHGPYRHTKALTVTPWKRFIRRIDLWLQRGKK